MPGKGSSGGGYTPRPKKKPTKNKVSNNGQALKAALYASASKGSSPSAGTRSAASDKNKKLGYKGQKAVLDRFASEQNTMKVLKSGKNKNTNKKYK